MDARKPRIAFLDTTRGLMVCVMTSAHAVTLAEPAPDEPYAWCSWLCRGATTHSFTILCGFTAALALSWEEPITAAGRARRRAGQLLIVMFVSNLAMLLARHGVEGRLAEVMELQWWLGLATLQTPYSISGVLLPMCLFLLLAPVLHALYRRGGEALLAIIVLLAVLIIWGMKHQLLARLGHLHLVRVLWQTGAGGFAVLPLASLGAAGFAGGLFWRAAATLRRQRALLGGGLGVLLLSGAAPLRDHAGGHDLAVPVLGLGRFALLLILGLILHRLQGCCAAVRALPLLGKYALFGFLAHRVVMQGLEVGLRQVPIRAEGRYLMYCSGTLFLVILLCWLRERYAGYNRVLKRAWL
jgi:hypothetical protein